MLMEEIPLLVIYPKSYSGQIQKDNIRTKELEGMRQFCGSLRSSVSIRL